MALPDFPRGWQVRQGAGPGVTLIEGWAPQQGVVVALALGGLLLPLLLAVSGVVGALVALLGCLAAGLGFGYRLVIEPGGMVYQRTWYGLRWRRRQLPLQTPVTDWSTFEQPEGEALVLESKPPITLSARKGTVEALRRAVQEAVLRAGQERPSA